FEVDRRNVSAEFRGLVTSGYLFVCLQTQSIAVKRSYEGRKRYDVVAIKPTEFSSNYEINYGITK
ncbi:hypothetical protein J6590_100289, partial [Homalodisca vitripennis]